MATRQGYRDAREYLEYLWGVWKEDSLVEGEIESVVPITVSWTDPNLRPGEMSLRFLVNSRAVWVYIKYEKGLWWPSAAGFVQDPAYHIPEVGKPKVSWYQRLFHKPN